MPYNPACAGLLACQDCAADAVSASGNLDNMRSFVDNTCAQYALLGLQLMWTADMQLALEQCKVKKNAMKDVNTKALNILTKLSSWCLQVGVGVRLVRARLHLPCTVLFFPATTSLFVCPFQDTCACTDLFMLS